VTLFFFVQLLFVFVVVALTFTAYGIFFGQVEVAIFATIAVFAFHQLLAVTSASD
jgi:hypothetical protein